MRLYGHPSPSAAVIRRSETALRLVEALRRSNEAGSPGPAVLDLVNELAWVCEHLFEAHAEGCARNGRTSAAGLRRLHAGFLKRYAVYAEEIRSFNGEIPAAFFDFLRDGETPDCRSAA